MPKTQQMSKGGYFPTFLKPRRTGEQAVMAVIQEACTHGILTYAVDNLLHNMGLNVERS